MFDPSGGEGNVFKAVFLILTLMLLVGGSVVSVYAVDSDAPKTKIALATCFGFGVWCFLLYIGNPSLEFWAPVK